MTAQQLEWRRPAQDQPGTLESFGRQLRHQYGDVASGLDDQMLGLLEMLFDVPYQQASPFASDEMSAK